MALAALHTEFGRLVDFELDTSWQPTKNMARILVSIGNLKDDEETKEVITEVIKLFIREVTMEYPSVELMKDCRNMIINFFSMFHHKKAMKKFLLMIVQQYGIIHKIIQLAASEIYDEMHRDNRCNVVQCSDFFYFVTVVQTIENFDFERIFPDLFPLCLLLFDAYTHHALYSFQQMGAQVLPEVNALMNEVMREILAMYVKDIRSMSEFKTKYSRSIFIYSYIVLFNENIKFEMRTKAGLLFVQSYSAVNLDGMSLPPLVQQQEERDSPPIEIPKAAKEKFYNLFNALQGTYKDNEYVIIIYSSILSVVPENILFSETVRGKSLVCALYEGILETAKKLTSHPTIIIEASRIICLLGKHFKNIPTDVIAPLFERGLDYVSSHIDHYIDTVRTYSKYFLEKLIESAATLLRSRAFGELTEILIKRMKEMTQGNNLAFLYYDNFSKYYGVHALLAQFNDMIDILLGYISDATIADISCKTYTSIMERAFPNTAEQRVEWSKTWVLPVLKILKTKNDKEVQGYCQKIFCSAFKLQPTMLRVVFPRDYLGSTEESACLLTCLNQARKRNLEIQISGNECNMYWRGLVDRKRMDTYMIHQDEDIRILVLACIVDSQRTTETFIDWEFVFLITYIRYNIPCEIPKIRKQMVEFYKKALKRFDAGYKVVLRHVTELSEIMNKFEQICKQYQEGLKNIRAQIQALNQALETLDEAEGEGGDDQIHKQIQQLNQQYQLLSQQYAVHLDQIKEQNGRLSPYKDLQKSYKRFIMSFTKIMIGNLSYDSNYPRRAVSLELLQKIRDILPIEEWQICWNEEDIKNSHNVLFDSYESNKKLMVDILRSLPPKFMGFTNLEFTYKYLNRSLELAMSVRPSQTLAAAYLLEVCTMSPFFGDLAIQEDPFPQQCEDFDWRMGLIAIILSKLVEEAKDICIDELQKDDLQTAIYGLVFAIRLQLEGRDLTSMNQKYVTIFNVLAEITIDIADAVMPIVCDPSPEGYLPLPDPNLSSNVVEEFSRAQKLLVYSWRTVKEIMLLISEMVRQAVLLEDEVTLLNNDNLHRVGGFFLKIFYESKHRGVFEQAHVAFTTICDSFVQSKNDAVNILPKNWLTEATKIVAGRANRGISSTRRSAGLPFLILATLCAEIKQDPACFQVTMQALFKAAENPATTPRVNEYKTHSMNVLRAIFRHSKLGEHVAPFVGRGVTASIEGFNTEVWGVRNSATLLYAALITRIFGVQRTSDSEELSIKNMLTVRVFITRYPELHEFLLKTLEEECGKHNSLVLHPVLTILSRLYPSHSEEYNDQIEKYLPFVHRCLSNPVYQTRELAAKASVALINKENTPPRLSYCFDKISRHEMNDTECHGYLLQIWYMLKMFKENAALPFHEYIRNGLSIIENIGKKYSHMTANLYIEIVTNILYTQDFQDMPTLKDLLTLLEQDTNRNVASSMWKSKYLQNKVILSTFIFTNKFAETDITQETISNQILHYLVADDGNMKRFSLNLLIALNQKLRLTLRIEPKVHPLIETSEVEIPAEVDNLVGTLSTNAVKKILTACHGGLKDFIQHELVVMRHTSRHDRVLFFILASYYPCAIRFLTESKQKTLRTLLRYCDTSSEEVIGAVIICVGTFVDDCDPSLLNYGQLIDVLERSASPKADVCRRVAVTEFMNRNFLLYCNHEPYLRDFELKTMLNILVVLLEDDELLVRNKMANFENNAKVRMVLNSPLEHIMPVVPEKAREDAIILMTILLPPREAINLMISWGCRYFPDPAVSCDEVFERGELNLYAENTPLIDVCARMLIKTLWAHHDGLNFDDQSIFIEEKTMLVTTAILDALNTTFTTKIILSSTRVALINVLTAMYKFLETVPICSNTFYQFFKRHFKDKVIEYMTQNLDQCDMFCVKKLIRKLFDPVYKHANDNCKKMSVCT